MPCAGVGARLKSLTQFLNKSLVSIANRPTICHLIEQFPSDVEFVIALGYKGHLIREFLSLAYPRRQFYFVEVTPFEGPGSGLGLSIQTCKQYLQQPFIFISCDTLVEEKIPSPDANWMGYSDTASLLDYRTLGISSGLINTIAEKGEGQSPLHKAYIGLAGIYSYNEFWESMEQGGQAAIETGESHGMRGLLSNCIRAHQFTWHDMGNPNALAMTRNRYRDHGEPHILEKANEAIWFVGGTVIKFSDDKSFIANRVKRVEKIKNYVPEVTGSESHMYRYSKVEGKVFSEVVTLPLFDRLLEHCKTFWQVKTLSPTVSNKFKKTCKMFYHNKTLERVALFYKNFDCKDGVECINGEPMPSLEEILQSLDWSWLASGLPGRFHGDFHFENILWCEPQEKFTFLDWRQDFGGDLTKGDIYYDLAKLLHGVIVNHELIARNLFSVKWEHKSIEYDFHRKQILVECEKYFKLWLENNGYDYKKTRVLTALIYLNIAALHRRPYSLLLYALGKNMLIKELEY